MYHLIVTHSVLRYVVLLSLVVVVVLALRGFFQKTKYPVALRVWSGVASGISHVQLLLGFALYFQSPVVQVFWADRAGAPRDSLFFALIHFGLMSTAIVLLTIGAAAAKREPDDQRKFRLLLGYFGVALLLILIAIPWPFSPLAQRPFLRSF
jgi:hypothetical protein